jgi:hypothetical protein
MPNPVSYPLDGASVVLGEVHTALLQSSASLPLTACERLVRLVNGERVRSWQRPIAHAVSPRVLTGIDCRLPVQSGTKTRAIGTVNSHASITGGHVVQGSTRASLYRSPTAQRLPWSYYLARPGQVFVIGKADWDDIASGFVPLGRVATPDLDLGAVSARMIDQIQHAAAIDRRAPFPASRTRLRWAAVGTDDEPVEPLRFAVTNSEQRALVVYCRRPDLVRIAEFAEDLALHDWLLTTLLRLIERSRLGIDGRATVLDRLRPAVEHLLHLWMPAARLDERTAALWQPVERRAGLDRQWTSAVTRIRDQMALSTIALLSDRPGEAAG